MTIPPEVFAGKPHRLSMGLRRLELAEWLDADPEHPQRGQRRTLLSGRLSEVYAVEANGSHAAEVVARSVAAWVGEPLRGEDAPLVEAAQMVRDDLCVLAHREGSWRLVAAVVCFPSRWRLADKMGRDVVSIHDPVPGYRGRLGAPTEAVFTGLSPRWRVNWTLLDDPELFQPHSPGRTLGTPDDSWYLRIERQCLVPVGEAIAFTIRTDVVALRDLDEPRRRTLLSSAASAPADLAAYRGWVSE